MYFSIVQSHCKIHFSTTHQQPKQHFSKFPYQKIINKNSTHLVLVVPCSFQHVPLLVVSHMLKLMQQHQTDIRDFRVSRHCRFCRVSSSRVIRVMRFIRFIRIIRIIREETRLLFPFGWLHYC